MQLPMKATPTIPQPVIHNDLAIVAIKLFSMVEIQNAVKRFKNRKLPGICRISAELLKSGDGTMLLWLQMLFSATWNLEIFPEYWCTGVLQPLWKRKGSKKECSNSREITLLSAPGKLFSMFLLQLCFAHVQRKCRVDQAVFMPGRSTTERICSIRQIIENVNEFRQQDFIAYIEFKAVFDSFDRDSL